MNVEGGIKLSFEDHGINYCLFVCFFLLCTLIKAHNIPNFYVGFGGEVSELFKPDKKALRLVFCSSS